MKIAPYIKFAVLIVAVALAAASADPHHRSTVARVALFALVGTVAVALIDLARRRSPAPEASPFEPLFARPGAAGLPGDLERMAVDVRAFHATLERDEPIVPGPLRRACRRIALGRVAERHPGHVDQDRDDATLAAVLEPELWAALDGQPTALDADAIVTRLEQL